MIKSYYEWRELTPDGLLKTPEDVGPYYSTSSFNPWGGHDTKEQAVERLDELKRLSSWDVTGEYVLVTVYKAFNETNED